MTTNQFEMCKIPEKNVHKRPENEISTEHLMISSLVSDVNVETALIRVISNLMIKTDSKSAVPLLYFTVAFNMVNYSKLCSSLFSFKDRCFSLPTCTFNLSKLFYPGFHKGQFLDPCFFKPKNKK